MTIAVVVILVSVASSMVMWRKRLPQGVGAPRKEPNRTLGVGLLFVIIILGMLFPLLGASILLVVITDLLVIQRVPRSPGRSGPLRPTPVPMAPDRTAGPVD